MLIRPRTIISACGVGADLHLAIVEASALGVRVRPGPVIKDVMQAQPDALRRAGGTGSGLPRAGTLVFVCPGELAAVRPIGVGVSGFVGARADLHRSVGRLVPIAPENALIGLIERHHDEAGASAPGGPDAAGFLYAARRDAIEAWSERLRTIVGRGPDAILTPAMALLGLGGQRTETLVGLERTPSGAMLAHTLRFGRASEIAEPIDSERLQSLVQTGATIRSLPTAPDDRVPLEEWGAIPISGAELAIAGAMAMLIAGGELVPLTGAAPRTAPRWASGIAAAVAAILLAWGALGIRGYRYQRAIERLDAAEHALDADVARVQAMRDETTRLGVLLRDGVGATTARWSPRMADLAGAAGVIPEGGFLYRLVATGNGGITIDGEAPKASTVLTALEASPRFANARQQNPTVPVPERNSENFGLHADYEHPASHTPANEGGAK